MLLTVIIAVVLILGYLVSLRLHPFRRCRLCRGSGRHWGAIYTSNWRACRACGGRGRADRLGVRMLGLRR